MSEIRAAALTDLAPGEPRLVEVDGVPLVLVRVGDQVHAINDICTHQGGPLSEGKLSGTRLACPWHGWMYDVRTGQCLMPSRGRAVPSYPVRLDGDDVWVDIGSSANGGGPDAGGPAGPNRPGAGPEGVR